MISGDSYTGLSAQMNWSFRSEDLSTVDIASVLDTVEEIRRELFPKADGEIVRAVFADVEAMFAGTHWEYEGMDTVYHDLEHTLRATLCWVLLVGNRHLHEVEPRLSAKSFLQGLFGILLHDVGYLKERDDADGSGAKYTFVHEQRSCELAELYLERKGWHMFDIFAVQHLISCTGPRSIPDAIPFRDELERLLGESICTADYLGQVSDPRYIEKLPALFTEFEESDDYREVPHDRRMFKSCEELLRLTPHFWRRIVLPKLEEECHGLYKFLSDPYPDGTNPYLVRIEQNIEKLKSEARKIGEFERYFGKRTLNFWG